jgi:hypothetical protein
LNTTRILMMTLLVLVPSVMGVGMSPSHYVIEFEPLYSQKITFEVFGEGNIEVFSEGDLAEYISVSPLLEEDDRQSFIANINLPETLPEGTYKTIVGVQEMMSGEGLMTAGTRVQAPIIVKVTASEQDLTVPVEGNPSQGLTTIVAIVLIGALVFVNIMLFIRNALKR